MFFREKVTFPNNKVKIKQAKNLYTKMEKNKNKNIEVIIHIILHKCIRDITKKRRKGRVSAPLR
jgi:hypothetical protein